MAELKTKANDGDVDAFLDAIPDDQRRTDAKQLCALMSSITGHDPVMWGPAIIGFGSSTLTYASGRQVDWMRIGFSPRKASLSLYLTCDIDRLSEQLNSLGRYTTGKGCLYIKRLSDVDTTALHELIEVAYAQAGDGSAD